MANYHEEPMESEPSEVGKFSKAERTVLNDLRTAGQLCDGVIQVEDGQFTIHRYILAACSPYFRALFTNGMKETSQTNVFIPGIPYDMMRIVIEFAYTRATEVSVENVEALLPIADRLHVLGLLRACCAIMASNLDFENCIGIGNFARFYFCSELKIRAQQYLHKHFTEVATDSSEILNMPIDEAIGLFSADDLNVRNEEIVFRSIIRWIDHEAISRRSFIADLLKSIRLGLLNPDYVMETVKKHPFIRENDSCRPIIIETLKILYDLDIHERTTDITHQLTRPRIPHDLLFVVGGWSGGSPTNTIEIYDTRSDGWFTCRTPDIGPRAYHGCATIDGRIYIVGGFDGVEYFNSVRCFCPSTKTWQEVAPMYSRRCYVSVAVLDGCIYAMGGFDGHVRLNTAERYSPQTNQWTILPPMHHQRSDASASALNDKIFITGGFNGQHCLDTAEYFDPIANQWILISPMMNRRSGVGAIAYSGSLYAVGGFDGLLRLNNAEKYNTTTNSWSYISEMASPRSNFGIEVIDDKLLAIGGFNGEATIYTVEYYADEADEWYQSADMSIFRSALSACIVKDLPNVTDYINTDRQKPQARSRDLARTLTVTLQQFDEEQENNQ